MLATVTDPINRTTQFFYNPQGHLTQVSDTRDKLWQYDYTEAAPGFDLLSRVTDPDNRILD
jgi:YD repeat-containing protein